jgi:serine/threonine-protein kinase
MAKTCPICNTSYPDSNAFCTNDGATLLAEEKSEDLVGSVIADRYQVSKLLGEGGMGRVYLAKHVRLPQQAAIKVLHPGMIKEADAVARFNREAGNAARIEHDRVARVFDFGETRDGLVYLAMEFVPGRTLREILLTNGRLTPARAANITHQVSDGLDAAHRIGIIHRDLKPDNILVITDDNGTDRSKVVDFGIAKAMDSNQTQLTQTGMLVGTPEFMSPEQVLGETLDARSDVYALALVSYQLFTGALPFGGSTPERSLAARLMEDPKPLSAVAPDVDWPQGLQDAFDRALAREPNERTPSSLEFGDTVVSAVEQWLGVSVLRGRTPMSTPSLVTSAALMSPSATSTRTAATPMVTAVNQQPAVGADAPIARSSSKRGMMFAGGGLLVAAVATVLVLMPKGPSDTGNVANTVAPLADGSNPATTTPSGNTSTPSAANGSPGNAAVPKTSGDRGANQSVPLPGAVNPTTVAAGNGASPVPSQPAAGESAELTADRSRLAEWKAELQGSDGERIAPIVINSVTQMLPRLRTPADSFQAYLRRFEAKVLTSEGDRLISCPDLDNAKRLARRLSSTEVALLKPWDALGCPD